MIDPWWMSYVFRWSFQLVYFDTTNLNQWFWFTIFDSAIDISISTSIQTICHFLRIIRMWNLYIYFYCYNIGKNSNIYLFKSNFQSILWQIRAFEIWCNVIGIRNQLHSTFLCIAWNRICCDSFSTDTIKPLSNLRWFFNVFHLVSVQKYSLILPHACIYDGRQNVT